MGRLIKGKGQLLPKVVMDARQDATRIRQAAVAEADLIAKRAQAAAVEAVERAHAEGLAKGREDAKAELTELIVRARQEADQMLVATRDSAIPLARKMAERIVGRALELHPSLMTDIAAQALVASRARSGSVVLRVHPADLEVLNRDRTRLNARLPTAVDLKLVADDKVAQGGCIIETPIARLDAQLSRQLDALEKALGDRAGAKA